jgi:alpha(1,3/1,4) fucosyltransferase
MSALRVACVDFWPGFEPGQLLRLFPELAQVAEVELVPEPARAELIVFSTFVDGRKVARPRDPRSLDARGTRLFYTAENVRPDFATCDFALSFCRELVDARHLRVPNFVVTQRAHGYAGDALLHPHPDPAAARRAKTRFCAYVQGNRVALREEFVQKLARYKRVDCAGPSLNNTGFVADRRQKYELYRASKFAVTFENEPALGYTTEKLPDALLEHCVPIYFGDPTVRLDFDPACFLHLRDFPTAEALIERIAELDQDDAAYERLLGARRLPGGVLPPHADPAVLRAFFARVAEAARRARHRARPARV